MNNSWTIKPAETRFHVGKVFTEGEIYAAAYKALNEASQNTPVIGGAMRDGINEMMKNLKLNAK